MRKQEQCSCYLMHNCSRLLRLSRTLESAQSPYSHAQSASAYGMTLGTDLLPGGKWEGAIEPGAVVRLTEDALRTAHDYMLKAAPACTAPVRHVCKRSHLQAPGNALSHHTVWRLPFSVLCACTCLLLELKATQLRYAL